MRVRSYSPQGGDGAKQKLPYKRIIGRRREAALSAGLDLSVRLKLADIDNNLLTKLCEGCSIPIPLWGILLQEGAYERMS